MLKGKGFLSFCSWNKVEYGTVIPGTSLQSLIKTCMLPSQTANPVNGNDVLKQPFKRA